MSALLELSLPRNVKTKTTQSSLSEPLPNNSVITNRPSCRSSKMKVEVTLGSPMGHGGGINSGYRKENAVVQNKLPVKRRTHFRSSRSLKKKMNIKKYAQVALLVANASGQGL